MAFCCGPGEWGISGMTKVIVGAAMAALFGDIIATIIDGLFHKFRRF